MVVNIIVWVLLCVTLYWSNYGIDHLDFLYLLFITSVKLQIVKNSMCNFDFFLCENPNLNKVAKYLLIRYRLVVNKYVSFFMRCCISVKYVRILQINKNYFLSHK